MLIVLTWILNILILFYEWRKKSLGMVLWAMLFVVFTLPNTLHAYSADYNRTTIVNASVIVVLFMAIYILVRFFYFYKFSHKKLEIEVADFEQTPEGLFHIIFLIYLTCFTIVVIGFYGRGYSLIHSSWAETLNMPQTSIEVMAGKIMVAFSGLGFVCLCKKKYVHFIISLGIYIFCALYSKSRYNLIGFLIPFIIYFIFNKKKKKVIIGVTSGILLVFAVFIFQQIRWLGDIRLIAKVGLVEILQRSVEYMRQGQGELGLLKAFYYFVEHDNMFYKFGLGLGYVRLAAIFLPSSLATFKPRDFAIDMYKEWFHFDNPRGTMHPTLYGDVFANFGYAGILMGSFYGIFVSFIDCILMQVKDPTIRCMKVSMICTMYILIGRGAVYNAIFNFIIGAVAIDLIYFGYIEWRKLNESAISKCIK